MTRLSIDQGDPGYPALCRLHQVGLTEGIVVKVDGREVHNCVTVDILAGYAVQLPTCADGSIDVWRHRRGDRTTHYGHVRVYLRDGIEWKP